MIFLSATKKRGLGKGLSALIADKEVVDTILSEDTSNEKIENISIDLIIPKEDQPRKYFDDDALKELAESIKINGIIQPIILRKINDRYQIVAGERRWRAAKSIELSEIPAIIRELDDIDVAKISLIENVQRENLNPIEEAFAYKSLMEDYDLTQEELGKAVGKSRTYVSNSIRLLNLDDSIIKLIEDGKLSSGHGKALLGIKNKNEQIETANNIVDFGMNVRDTEIEVRKSKSKTKSRIGKKDLAIKDPYIIDLEENLMRTLGTKVNLVAGDKKGKIEIEYYGEDDLERLMDLLTH